MASKFQLYTDDEAALMGRAFDAAWQRLTESTSDVLEPSRVNETRELLGLKIIELIRQVPPDVDHLRDEALRQLGFVHTGTEYRASPQSEAPLPFTPCNGAQTDLRGAAE